MTLGGDINNPATLIETIALEELSDVAITSVADNELLAYDNSSGDWINQTASEAGLLTSPIDISANTNLAVSAPIVLTDDTLSLATIDIGDDTNLAVSSPIQLIGDTLSFSFSTANTWTGTNTFEDEVEGTKHSTVFTKNDEFEVGLIADKFIELGGVELGTGKGMTTLTAGSVVGVTVNYDCTSVDKISALQVQVMVNGSRVWNNTLVTTTGTNKRFEFTQARDVDSFSAGDYLGISFAASGVAGTIDLEKVIVELVYYYDD